MQSAARIVELIVQTWSQLSQSLRDPCPSRMLALADMMNISAPTKAQLSRAVDCLRPPSLPRRAPTPGCVAAGCTAARTRPPPHRRRRPPALGAARPASAARPPAAAPACGTATFPHVGPLCFSWVTMRLEGGPVIDQHLPNWLQHLRAWSEFNSQIPRGSQCWELVPCL